MNALRSDVRPFAFEDNFDMREVRSQSLTQGVI